MDEIQRPISKRQQEMLPKEEKKEEPNSFSLVHSKTGRQMGKTSNISFGIQAEIFNEAMTNVGKEMEKASLSVDNLSKAMKKLHYSENYGMKKKVLFCSDFATMESKILARMNEYAEIGSFLSYQLDEKETKNCIGIDLAKPGSEKTVIGIAIEELKAGDMVIVDVKTGRVTKKK